MKKIGKLAALTAVVMATGCSTTTKSIPQTDTPTELKTKKLHRDQYSITGTVQGAGETTYFLKFIELSPNFLGMGHSDLGMTEKKAGSITDVVTGLMAGGSKAHSLALYNAIKDKDDQDMIITPRYTVETGGIPLLFETKKVTVKAKTVKIKTDEELK